MSNYNLTVQVDSQDDDYSVTGSGTFRKGAFAIKKEWKDLRFEDLEQTILLGQGASGVVYLAKHKTKSELIALKNISVFDAEKRNQILKELDALYNSESPHMVGFYGVFYNDGSISIALEYMEGGSLKDIYSAMGPIPEHILSMIIEQVLLALQYLHMKKKMVHRDIKPSNILMNRLGEFKISDFGVSANMDNTYEQCKTFVGTVTYMSPERLEGKPYSWQGDVWSIGLTVLECATGKFPFLKEDGTKPLSGFWELLSHIKKSPPPQLDVRKGFSPEIADFVALCLNKNLDKRPHVNMLLQHPFITKYKDNIHVKNEYCKWTKQALHQIQQKHMTSDTKNTQDMEVEQQFEMYGL